MVTLFKPARSTNFYAWYMRPNGKQDQFSCRTPNEKEAYRFAVKEAARRLADTTSRTKVTSQLLSEFAKEYIEFVRGSAFRPKTVLAIESSFRLFIKRLGDKPLTKIRLEDCQKFIYTGQPSQFTARKHYGHLRAAFRKAVEWERLARNPFEQFTKPRAPELEAEYLSERDFELLYLSFPTETFFERRLRNLCVLAFETGMRLGELRNIERRSIDYQAGSLLVINTESFRTKSGKSRSIPLSPIALEAIQEQLRENYTHRSELVRESVYLFPSEQGTPLTENGISREFKLLCAQVFPSRSKLHFHSLRHSFGTNHALKGVSPQEIQVAMGHSSVKVTERYAHLQRLTFPNLRRVQNERRSMNRAEVCTKGSDGEVTPNRNDVSLSKLSQPVLSESALSELALAGIDISILLEKLGQEGLKQSPPTQHTEGDSEHGH